jgi:sn-glycerol 3-phosphate transport system permease protein
MVERRPLFTALSHVVLLLGVLIVAFPVYITFVASTHTAAEIVQAPMPLLPGDQLLHNYAAALTGSERGPGSGAPVARMMWISLVTALVISVGKIAISLLSAFAIVYFRFPFKMFFFWVIFVTLMLPVEVRIFPTYQVVADLGMLNTYAGLTIPLTNEDMYPVVIGIKRMISGGDSAQQWNLVMATAMLAMIPPALVVMLMQKWFVKGLVDTEK